MWLWYSVVWCGVGKGKTILRHSLVLPSHDTRRKTFITTIQSSSFSALSSCDFYTGTIWRQPAVHWMYVQYCARTRRNNTWIMRHCAQCRSRDIAHYKVQTKSSPSNLIRCWNKIQENGRRTNKFLVIYNGTRRQN